MQEPTVWLIPEGRHAKHHREQPAEYQRRMGYWVDQALERFYPGPGPVGPDPGPGPVVPRDQNPNPDQNPNQDPNPGPDTLNQNRNYNPRKPSSFPTCNGSDKNNEKKKKAGSYNVPKKNASKKSSSPRSSGKSGSSSSKNSSPSSNSYNPRSYNPGYHPNSSSYPSYNNNYSNAPGYNDFSGWDNAGVRPQEKGKTRKPEKKYVRKRDILALDETYGPEMEDQPDPIRRRNAFF